ncbi:CaiB/BaiF CoA transferase family protein [Actinophytocola xinjiangensis]|uniref:CaiB/BaiF CoA transferase family protein n=1 Tax=Actinophytocola xinjiangensis TaxID=485602 RepID=UPI000A066F4C|nr:CoA transferase [Actinophytocola xinjiangensis]
MQTRLLDGLRVVEIALFEAGGVGTVLADLGADVVKIERPGTGDPVRTAGWPFVEGVSLMHHHLGRGKRSVALDLAHPDGAALATRLMLGADVVVEGMRPGALDRRGLGAAALRARRPELVWCTVSGYGTTGPYARLAAHGLAFDAWAGLMTVTQTPEGHPSGSVRVPLGTRVTPLLAATSVLAAVLRARTSGAGATLDIAEADAAMAVDWLTVEGHRAHERPESEVTGNPNDGGARREPGTAGIGESVRYQVYRSRDGHVLFMATEQKFWVNFCTAVGRPDLTGDGATATSHAIGDHALRRELAGLFTQRSTVDWVALGLAENFPVAPVNDPRSLADDPHFRHRNPWLPAAEYGADLVGLPVHLVGERLAPPAPAPAVGQHTDEVLRAAGVSDEDLHRLRAAGALA